jgi:hypothetical protein
LGLFSERTIFVSVLFSLEAVLRERWHFALLFPVGSQRQVASE